MAQESPARIHSNNQDVDTSTNQYNKYSHHPANHSGKTNVKANKMAQSAAASDNKKRKLTSIINHKEILFLNVGGAKRNIRRSVWNALRDASCGGKTPSLGQGGVEARVEVEVNSSGSQNQGNPLCDLVLKGAAHWSDVPPHPMTMAPSEYISIVIHKRLTIYWNILSMAKYF